MKPHILDLFCCQGGASRGYADAGFEVTGVDHEPQPRFPYRFVQADAIKALGDLLATDEIGEYQAIHASPPCQRKTKAQKIRGREHPALIAPTRRLLQQTGLPYVIENVVPEGEDDDPLIDPVMLCGAMFGLQTYRHRLFEVGGGFTITAPEDPEHTAVLRKMGRPRRPGEYAHYVGNFSGVQEARDDMGMPWANRDGLREAIPPAYTRHVGAQLMAYITVGASA